MTTNRVASVILFDTSQSMSAPSDNGLSYFKRSLECLKRMILRKMFSQDNDELGIILFGTDETENDLARSSLYNYITVFSNVALPNWELFRKVENLNMSNRTESDWIEALILSIDFMKTQTQGRKYKNKQIVVFSSFSDEIKGDEESVKPIVSTLAGENVSLIVVGDEMSDECESSKATSSLHLIFSTVTQLDSGIYYSFAEIEKDLMYFEKKRKMTRLSKTVLSIGTNIQLPVRWMKINNEQTRFKWETLPHEQAQYFGEQRERGTNDASRHNAEVKYISDVVKTTNFGATLVDLGYADIESMKRKTGAPSFIYLGSVKCSKISRSMFVGNDIYAIVPEKDGRSVAMFSAFVDALIKAGRYGIARRVAVRNGKIAVGALLPISDELGKALTFLKLPYAEWIQKVPEKPLPEPDNEEAAKAIDDLITAAMLPEDIAEEGKGILVRDPTFQMRCHALHQRAIGKLPESSVIDVPDCIQRLINPFPLNDEAQNALERIAKLFPFEESQEKPVEESLEEPGSSKIQPGQSHNYKPNIVTDAVAAKFHEEFEQVKQDPSKATANPYSEQLSEELFR